MSASLLFLRPWWLLALLLLPLWFWWSRRRAGGGGSWRQAVDAHLLPHLLAQGSNSDQRWRGVVPLLAATLGIVALAGPSWRQTAAPLWQTEAPLVVALDLSSAMRTADLPPSRLTQAKARLRALFEQRRGGQTGLLVYAGDAFAVAPITRDGQTLIALLDSLQPDIMPVDGQRMDRALDEAQGMLQAAGFVRGDILLVSNQDDGTGAVSARRVREAGFVTSVLGVGTAAGAPLADADGFVSGPDGKLQLSRLDAGSLRALAAAGGGRYADLQVDGSDLRTLDLLDAQGGAQERGSAGSDEGLQRSDDGYWLILPLLAVALLLFRRGAAVLILLCSVGGTALLQSRPAWAQSADATPAATSAATPGTAAGSGSGTGTEEAARSTWQSWWQRADQRARAALDAGDAQSARELATDPALKAAAAYRTEDYEAAALAWGALPDPDADAHYNRGNALARAGKLKEALLAYDQALASAPQMEDAIANRKAVEDFLRRQQQQQQQQQGQQGQQDQNNQQGQQDQQQGQQGEQSGDPSQQSDTDDQEGSSADPQSGQDGESADDRESEQGGADQSSEPSGGSESSAEGESNDTGDEQSAEQARAALSEQMQDALQQQQEQEQAAQQQAQSAGEDNAGEQGSPAPALSAAEREELEKSQALQQWLRRVPDDPGSLLRRKFAREYQQRQRQSPPKQVP